MPIHSEKKLLPYRPEQLYELVADVEDYPNFLPWCIALRVLERSEHLLRAEMLVGFKVFRESFISRVTLMPTDRIDVEYLDGPFHHLQNRWLFRAADGGCEVDFYVDFEFRSRILRKIAGPVFGEAVRRMVHAFEQRAAERFGRG